MDFNFGKTDNYFQVLSKNYNLNGEISWNEFDSDQKKNKSKVVIVKQEDFKYGTLRIREACTIKLSENIYFNPNRPETWINKTGQVTRNFSEAVSIDNNRELDWWPDFKLSQNKQYFEKDVRNAYRLGFFTAIALEAENIIINLNNYTLQQHPEHALQQRFFSVIELADQPFVPKQGPANFGVTIRSSSNVAIINGKIGLSSHHGIHGNGIKNIMVKNVDFIDNEVCGIALNGCVDVYLVNVNIVRNRHDIPVMGSYSAGRFLKLFTTGLNDAISKSSADYRNYLNMLNDDLDKTFNAVILNNDTIPNIYNNRTGLIDGNYYGIVINPMGVAVNAPLENRTSAKANETCNIYMKTVSINNIKTNITEILAIKNSNNKTMTAPSGALFQFMNVSKKINDKYYYEGNSLSNLQIELVQVLKDNLNLKKFLGNFNFDEGLLIWRNNKESYFEHKENKFIGNNGLEGHDYEILGNGDSMFHVNKGTFGLKIDGLNTSVIDNLTISNIEANGLEGSTLAGNYQKSHPAQGHLNGYQGHLAYGVSLNASNDIDIENINVNNLSSKYGSSRGLSVTGESIKVKISNSIIENVTSCQTEFDYTKPYWPNVPTNARGIFVGNNCDVSTKNITLRNIMKTPGCINPSDCEFFSIVKTLD